MPEIHVLIRWPDGTTLAAYSPSLVVTEHFEADAVYSVPEFLTRARTAWHEASERVRARYGTPCSLAMNQLAELERAARDQPSGDVVVAGFSRGEAGP